MANFTTRVELHHADDDDYDRLHAEMKDRGFTRTIKADDGTVYHLPTAEYDYRGSRTRLQVLDLAKEAAAATRRTAGIIVTESAGRTWSGLDKA